LLILGVLNARFHGRPTPKRVENSSRGRKRRYGGARPKGVKKGVWGTWTEKEEGGFGVQKKRMVGK